MTIMAPTRQKGRNYRRKQPSNSFPEDSDQEFRHPPASVPQRVAVDVIVQLNSSPVDLGGGDISSLWPERVTGDEDEGRQGGGSCRAGDEGQVLQEAEQEVSPTRGDPLSGGVDSGGLLIKKGVSHSGEKRIRSGIGYNLLKSMGWRENTGLGQSSNGIVDPILPTPKPNHLGIGFNPTAAHDAAQEAIRQIQKAKREERDRKLQEKLEKAEAAEEEAIFMRESSLAETSASYERLFATDARLQAASSLPQLSLGNKPIKPGQCPHCKQRFDTKHALNSHINARHARLLSAVKRQLKNERRNGGGRRDGTNGSRRSGRGQSARNLAPLSQNFSVYD